MTSFNHRTPSERATRAATPSEHATRTRTTSERATRAVTPSERATRTCATPARATRTRATSERATRTLTTSECDAPRTPQPSRDRKGAVRLRPITPIGANVPDMLPSSMTRRTLLQAALGGATGLIAKANAALRNMKITRVRYYESPMSRPMINQSFHVILVDTDAGITGVGEGGSKDMVEQCAQLLIGKNPAQIDHLWQYMYRAYFYPAGREKIHALGGLDMALWDIKAKALDVPVWQLIGGQSRDHVECYATAWDDAKPFKVAAADCIKSGFRAYRFHGGDPRPQGSPYYSRHIVQDTYQHCRDIREAVGPKGDWAIDFHTRFDFPDAVRLCTLIEPLEPYFVEDLVRSENPGVYKQLRPMVKVPIAVGEHFGDRWEVNELVEQRLIDYSRVSIPNCGGITEMLNINALCETHYVGFIPHFTGPIAEAALVHAATVFSGPAMMEMTGAAVRNPTPYLPKAFDFKDGKMWPNTRPGLGVEVDTSKLKLLAEIDKFAQPIPIYKRPDGSITNW